MIKKLLFTFLIIDFFLLIISYFIGGFGWILNSQIAFFSSLFVTFASFNSYKKMIEARVEVGDIPLQRDELDKIDDPHELYDEEKKKTINIKENIKNLKTTAPATFSIYRIGAYLTLFLSFLFLTQNSLFLIMPYLIGLLIVPLTTTFSLIFINFYK